MHVRLVHFMYCFCVDTFLADWCKKQWKKLRDYYYRVKKGKMGKSGKPATTTKPWIYFTAVDRILAACVEENYE